MKTILNNETANLFLNDKKIFYRNPFQEIDENRSTKTFFLGVQYNQIVSTANGLKNLQNIDKFIRLNGNKIRSLIEKSKTDCNFEFVVDIDRNSLALIDDGHFNPIESFCKVGDDEFDHKIFFSLNIDWEFLCSNDIGITEITFETILSHRWELETINKNDENDLTDDIITAIKVLIEKYGLNDNDDAE